MFLVLNHTQPTQQTTAQIGGCRAPRVHCATGQTHEGTFTMLFQNVLHFRALFSGPMRRVQKKDSHKDEAWVLNGFSLISSLV